MSVSDYKWYFRRTSNEIQASFNQTNSSTIVSQSTKAIELAVGLHTASMKNDGNSTEYTSVKNSQTLQNSTNDTKASCIARSRRRIHLLILHRRVLELGRNISGVLCARLVIQ